jgi:hypothetical protein
MEFLNAMGQYFTPEFVAILLTIVFVVMIFVVLKVGNAFAVTERGKALLQAWEQIDDYAEAMITTVATTPQEREVAHKLAADYSLKLGQVVDWRMALVLKKLEEYVENYIPFDLDLIVIYARAEHIYFQIQEQLNSHERRDN